MENEALSKNTSGQENPAPCPDCTESGLPLPDPYPDYTVCPHCNEPDIEIWCYEHGVVCYNCGGWIDHLPPDECPNHLRCKQPD